MTGKPTAPIPLIAHGWPPFFDGRLRMQIMMAIATWGPMSLKEIASMTGESARNTEWSLAARRLEKVGLILRIDPGTPRLKIGLDRRNPAHWELQTFCKHLYAHYLKPIAVWEPKWRRRPLTALEPKHDPATMNLHYLGSKSRARILHLVVAISASPGNILINGLGLSHGSYEAIQMWHRKGIIKLRNGRLKNKVRHTVHLDVTWPCRVALVDLIKKLNSWMPEYMDIANGYRDDRRLRRTAHSWRIRQAKIRSRGMHIVEIRRANRFNAG
jgi:hypothetical protein